MSRPAINFLLDFALLLIFVVLILATGLLRFVFPVATKAAGCTLWGLGYDTWCTIQFAALATMMFAVLLHLILHWTWVCGFLDSRLSKLLKRTIKSNEATRTLYGVTTLIVILTILGSFIVAGQFSLRAPMPANAKNVASETK